MPHFDLTGDTLRSYRPHLEVPQDLREFWDRSLSESPTGEATFETVDIGIDLIDTHDVTFPGFDGAPIKGWLRTPASATGPLPAVVEYVGYGGGRGLPHENLLWAAAGYAHFMMDTRGQGSTWSVGNTPDPATSGAPAHPGFMTDGILDPTTYYYRRLFVDAVRAVDAVLGHPLVDAEHIAVAGGSQGGGLAIAASALHGDVNYAMIDVPFLCDFPRATSIAPGNPYGEIVRYLKNHRDSVETVFRTLAYFDGAILGRLTSADSVWSVALMDETCPPSTVYAAYNWYEGPKSIVEYPFNDHEGGEAFHDRIRLDWLKARTGR